MPGEKRADPESQLQHHVFKKATRDAQVHAYDSDFYLNRNSIRVSISRMMRRDGHRVLPALYE